MNYEELLNKIQTLVAGQVSQSELARALNVERQNVNKRIKRKQQVKYEDCSAIAKYFSINENLLCDNANSLPHITIKEKDVDSIEAYFYTDVYGSCGCGVLEQKQYSEKVYVSKKFVTAYNPSKQYSIITARGNSMEPFINDGDLLLVEEYQNEQIIDNRIYVFTYENEIFIKRLVKNINQIVVISENKEFENIKLSGEELANIKIIGQIVGLIRDAR